MSDDAFGELMSSLNPPLVVVTTAVARKRAGCLVGFHTQSSIDPSRYSIWLSKANYTYRLAVQSRYFAVHFLQRADMQLAERFGTLSGNDTDKFQDLDVGAGPDGVPLLSACPHRLVARRTALLDEGGDHVCVVADVVFAESPAEFEPLRLSQAEQLDPGHGNEERQQPGG
jgi:flavin reductase (DIM6/NTAB) family NADH-FMN oxidoreductase RutF